MKLRPHHLLCTQGFSGMGYDETFRIKMTKITQILRYDSKVEIDLTFSTDDICQSCPRILGINRCADQQKVTAIDEKVIHYFKLIERKYNYQEIIQKIHNEITSAMMDDICSSCSWYRTSACKKNVLSGKYLQNIF